MQVKQKIMKGDPAKNRYNLNQKNYETTPGLPLDLNKENNPNMRNHHRLPYMPEKNNIELMRSMEVPKRLRTSVNQEMMRKEGGLRRAEPALMSSQQLFHFRKNQVERHQSANFGQHLTFGEVSKRPMMTSRQFQQQKAIKNEVIDELISNARRELCKSFNEFSGGGSCANHIGKKAKYRLMAQLSQGEEEMFYCSKCAINLLQQGFPIEEMRPEQPSAVQARSQQVAKLELRLNNLQERVKGQEQLNQRNDDLDFVQEEIFRCNQVFGEVFKALETLRKDRISTLTDTFYRLQTEKNGRKEGLQNMQISLSDLHREIEDYRAANRFASMRQNQFHFLATSLTNKLNTFEQALVSAKTPSPRQRLSLEMTSTQSILEKLKALLEDGRKGDQSVREESRREDFTCDQLKKPFRILFPNEESEGEKRSLLNSVRECPSFGQYPS